MQDYVPYVRDKWNAQNAPVIRSDMAAASKCRSEGDATVAPTGAGAAPNQGETAGKGKSEMLDLIVEQLQ